MSAFIEQLQHQLTLPLPGQAAQHRMANTFRRKNTTPPADARIACVLALFYPKDEQWHLVLIQRVSHDRRDRHSGQISFPGGKLEKSDPSLLDGALREAEEEVGVPAEMVQPLGRLTQLYIPVSNFLVHPFVGVANERPNFQPQLSEVQAILEVPFSQLQNPANIQQTNLKISDHLVLKDVPYYDIQGHVVWGATAMMLSELLEVVGRN
ncbi:MAG: CoA pyrophosphatase [Bacteroidota bacterium]